MDTVSIFILNYNGEKTLEETILSIESQDWPLKKISLIDDGSSDKSIQLVKNKFPNITILDLGYNSGHLNKIRNLAIQNSQTRYLLIIDNDIILEKTCINNMMSAMETYSGIGICTPRLMYYNNRKKINICWTKLHYLCASISPYRDSYNPKETEPMDTVGGGTMLIDKNIIEQIGTIDDSYPMGWGDDAELYIRMKIAGFRTIYLPDVIGFHHAKEWSKERSYRAFGQIYNRWVIILSMYQVKTIIFLTPAFFIYELFLFVSLTLKKLFKTYLSANFRIIKNIPYILKKRSTIQSHRQVSDKHFLTTGPIYIPQAHLTNPLFKYGIKCLDKIFNLYWYIIKGIL